jgi:CheY-like chemotaxis protein
MDPQCLPAPKEAVTTIEAGKMEIELLEMNPAGKSRITETPRDASLTACIESQPLGARILVAEDTFDTRRLVTLYLEDTGAMVEAVANGLLAVDAVRAAVDRGQPFDLVLMDMQMPEMDGYTATVKLRELGFKRLPILAFTAHATVEERQRCLRAGCNDCISKPIDYDELINAVENHSRRASQPQTKKAQSKLRSTRQDDPLLQDLLQEYIAGLPRQVAAMADSLAEQNLSQLREKVHQLSGSAGSYGFPEITKQARQTESLIVKSNAMSDIKSAVEALLKLLRSVEGYDPALESSMIV